jgi:hypothetical protein
MGGTKPGGVICVAPTGIGLPFSLSQGVVLGWLGFAPSVLNRGVRVEFAAPWMARSFFPK